MGYLTLPCSTTALLRLQGNHRVIHDVTQISVNSKLNAECCSQNWICQCFEGFPTKHIHSNLWGLNLDLSPFVTSNCHLHLCLLWPHESSAWFEAGNAAETACQFLYPKFSIYGIFSNIYPPNYPNVCKYSIHGAYGIDSRIARSWIPKNIVFGSLIRAQPRMPCNHHRSQTENCSQKASSTGIGPFPIQMHFCTLTHHK